MSTRIFTGRHMLFAMLGFFGTVIAVNFTMAWFASSTFGGTVVDNSYVASQKYNGWLAQARAQDRLGWATPIRLDAQRHVRIGVPGAGFTAAGTALHPLGRAADVPLRFRSDGRGGLRATTALPAGRWQVRLDISRGRDTKRLMDTLA
jgi:nitrogen fixation protein FixH